MLGCARPARIAANSSRVASTDLSILPSASLRMSLITESPGCSCVLAAGGSGATSVARERRADLLTRDRPGDGARLGEVEDDHVEVVVAGQADRGRVGDLEPAG